MLTKIFINAAAIWVAALVVPGVDVTGDGLGNTLLTLAVLGVLFGFVNTFIKPVVAFATMPAYLLTLGLMAFLVNALMLELVSWMSGKLGLNFTIDDFFWSAVLAALVVTVTSLVLRAVIRD
ncbi:MAG: putative rane protein [Actinomycetota bacterium]|nr:putative rane protein [Actinomycetota bacterium]